MRRFEIPNFVGGLQTKTSYLFHRENELGELVNTRIDLSLGALTNVNGYSQLGNTIGAAEIVGLTEYSKSDGTRKQVACCNGDIQVLSGSTWSAQVQTISTGVYSDFSVFLDKLFWVNGTDAPRTYNGTAWLTTTSQNSDVFHASQGDLVETYKGKVYIANKASSRVYMSSTPREILGVVVGDCNNTVNIKLEDSRYCYASMVVDIYKPGENVTQATASTISSVNQSKNSMVMASAVTLSDGAEIKLQGQTGSQHVFWGAKQDDYLEIDPSDGDNISAMLAAQDILHIWKSNSYHQWNGNERRRKAEQGASCQKAVQAYNDLLFWFNQEGTWVWPGQRIQTISNVIKPEIQQVSTVNVAKVGMGLNADHLLVGVGDLTSISNAIIDYNIESNIYQTWELPNEFKIFSPYTTSGKRTTMAGTNDGKIMELDSGSTFAGTTINSRIETREQFISLPEEVKTIYQIFVFAKRWGGVDAYINVDDSDKISLGPLTGLVTEFKGKWKGNYFRFGFLSSGKSFEIDSVVIYYDVDQAVK